ncbi:MAG: hypothetical protein IJ985_05860 [Akkermansia sp.]|nr:hypothetical protein [Akkermansia sp.]
MFRLLSILTSLILASLPCLADFDKPVQLVKLDYGQNAVTVVFQSKGAAITKVKPHCDCTTTSVSGTTLTAQVDTSKFDQSVDKQIDVTTADGKKTRLTMRFVVPQAIILSARSLVWKRGDAPTPQVLRITIPKGSPVQDVTEAALSGEDFAFTPAKGKNKREFLVSVAPLSTAKKAFNRLIIKTSSQDPRYAGLIVYLQVR